MEPWKRPDGVALSIVPDGLLCRHIVVGVLCRWNLLYELADNLRACVERFPSHLQDHRVESSVHDQPNVSTATVLSGYIYEQGTA